jgi:inositol-1,4,5-trisphosphate 5-phosphatase
MTDRRNADFIEITKRAIFSSSGSGTAPNSPNGHASVSTYSTVLDADLCVFFGDLNYRLDNLSIHEIRELIASRSFTSLRKHDQLKASRQAGKAFCGFEEGKLDFQPTYKFDKGIDRYDSSEKERKPAWTDRVLWKINEDQIEYLEDGERTSRLKVKCEEYTSIMEMRTSDHKPVLARMHIELDVVDEEAFNRVLHELEQEQIKA